MYVKVDVRWTNERKTKIEASNLTVDLVIVFFRSAVYPVLGWCDNYGKCMNRYMGVDYSGLW